MQIDSSMNIGASDKNGGSDMAILYYRGVHAILEFNQENYWRNNKARDLALQIWLPGIKLIQNRLLDGEQMRTE
jgi:hypothetical protein